MMCKRNIVIFLQQFVVSLQRDMPTSSPPATLTSRTMRMFPSIRKLVPLHVVYMVALSSSLAISQSLEVPTVVAFCDDPVGVQPSSVIANQSIQPALGDRVFLISTRHLTSDPCCAPKVQVPFRMWQLECGVFNHVDSSKFLSTTMPNRPVIVYIHGNRMPADAVIRRATSIHRMIRSRCDHAALDWVIFSWPSQRERVGIRDFRLKADRSDTQGMYLANFVRPLLEQSIPVAMIAYSFGARVATGALHSLAGGRLSGQQLPFPPLTGANIRVGLIAPAIESNSLGDNGHHALATKNMDRLLLLYNRRDAVLKRYWLLERVRRETALGTSGPTCFAPRVDGTRLPIRSRDCAPSVKIRHSELDYYHGQCNAGCDMARLINGLPRLTL